MKLYEDMSLRALVAVNGLQCGVLAFRSTRVCSGK